VLPTVHFLTMSHGVQKPAGVIGWMSTGTKKKGYEERQSLRPSLWSITLAGTVKVKDWQGPDDHDVFVLWQRIPRVLP
jgi:hypothetical protein